MSSLNHDSFPMNGFEGPEKRLEVIFKRHNNHTRNLFDITTEQWQTLLDEAKCTIMSSMKNEYCVAYVLSESSLFVFPYKIMLKTCGTTTLLRCIPVLLSYAETLGLEVEFVWFSHKNFNFPDQQLAPHCSFDQETAFLNKYFDGHDYILGPLSGDHWYLYLADYRTDKDAISPDEHVATMEILMQDIHPDVARQFVRSEDFVDAKTTTQISGVASLIPNSRIDDFMFDPCGYSMNGLKDQVYWTIHITPESHCSYISFEANIPEGSIITYQQLLQKVVSTFKPGRFVATLFTDQRSFEPGHHSLNALPRKIAGGLSLVARTSMDFADAHYNLAMASYTTCASLQALRHRRALASKVAHANNKLAVEFIEGEEQKQKQEEGVVSTKTSTVPSKDSVPISTVVPTISTQIF